MNKRNRLEIDVELVDDDTQICPKKMKFDTRIADQAKELLKLFFSFNNSQTRCVANTPYFPSFALPFSNMISSSPPSWWSAPLFLFAQQISYFQQTGCWDESTTLKGEATTVSYMHDGTSDEEEEKKRRM